MYNRPGITLSGENRLSDNKSKGNVDYIINVFSNAWKDCNGIWDKIGVILASIFIVLLAIIITMTYYFIVYAMMISCFIIGGYFAIAYICPLFGLEIVPWLATFLPFL